MATKKDIADAIKKIDKLICQAEDIKVTLENKEQEIADAYEDFASLFYPIEVFYITIDRNRYRNQRNVITKAIPVVGDRVQTDGDHIENMSISIRHDHSYYNYYIISAVEHIPALSHHLENESDDVFNEGKVIEHHFDTRESS